MRTLPWLLLLVILVGCTQDYANENGINVFSGGQDVLDKSEVNCTESDQEFFVRAIWPILATRCASCHEGQGSADFAFDSSDWQVAYEQTLAYVADNGELLLDKPTRNGISHGGQQLFTLLSDEANDFSELILRTQQIANSCPQVGGVVAREAGFTDFTNLSAARTARKAALLMQGRLPTPAEIAQAQQGDESLHALLYSYLKGDQFEAWLMDAANDQLLTRKYLNDEQDVADAMNADGRHYPNLNARITVASDAADLAVESCELAGGRPDAESELAICRDARALQEVLWETREQTRNALADEPLQLIRHIVRNDRSYGEILTARYRMMNPFSYDVLDGQSWSTQYDPMDASDWRPGQVYQYEYPRNMRAADGSWNEAGTLVDKTGRSTLPSAGLLSSPIFQLRYPSTDTNRNRARSRWTYYYFLGVDIESLAVRAMDPEELKNVSDPGDEGTSCYGCHILLDPVAGAFQSWANNGEYLVRNGMDSLPQTFIQSDAHNFGEQWYNRQLKPGFNGVDMPVISDFGVAASHDDGLQWLGEQLVADPRFASGTAKFWFPGLFGRQALTAPTESGDADYAARMQAYIDEQALISGWAENFRAHNLNLRWLLADMMMSPLFRGEFIDSDDPARLSALQHTGMGKLLTPEQLDRKLVATTGYLWKYSWQSRSRLLNDFYMFYGGINSDDIAVRPTELNSLMYSVLDRMANEISCTLVAYEFWPGVHSKLFTSVSLDTDPNTELGEQAIRNTIDNLLWRLWGIQDDSEQEALWQLYKALYDERMTLSDPPRYLNVNISRDSNDDGIDDDDNNNGIADEDEFDEACRILDLNEDDAIDVSLNWNDIDWQDINSIRAHIGSFYNPEQTLRPWVGVLAVMLSDIQFVTE